ncbi:MAG: EFR1 family ferrodoxin [Treponema sp.]|nr:EFR1 family ferrodoxin [Treponema sp.]
MLYFSGTGNSKFIAELFSHSMKIECYSIEEKTDFDILIASHEEICFCYPVYGSRVPRIMREFAGRHIERLKNKKLIILCTQMFFSGDGARAFMDLLPRDVNVIYAEHFFMPNNVCNIFITPLESEKKVEKYIINAKRRMQLVCRDITNGKIKKRGFNIVSRILGLPQGFFWLKLEKKLQDSVKINNNCNQCGLCASGCPMNNLELQNGIIIPQKNCIICYRCINKCPQKAITVFFKAKVKKQYKGITDT